MAERTFDHEFYHGHLFGAVGGGALGFSDAEPRLGPMRAKLICLGSIDVDAGACREFERRVGVKATCRDLFDLDQYRAFHGRDPGPDWVAATPDDVRVAMQNRTPDLGFLSAPCKGFSGLLPETTSLTDKYQALNALTLRGVWLWLEAFADNPVPLIFFENVPRIATRGRFLLDQIIALLQHYGYATAETVHDCGELGGLAQSRKRFLLVARHRAKVPAFMYEPPKRRLLGVGEILDRMPLPGDPRAGPMHRMPALQFKTWVRLALVEAGSDWRSLNRLNVEDGFLTDYVLMPDENYRHGVLGVRAWEDSAGVVAGRAGPTNGAFSVADPRTWRRSGAFGVVSYRVEVGTIQGESFPSNGKFAVADPRPEAHRHHGAYGVLTLSETSGVIRGASRVCHGPFAVADPRILHRTPYSHVLRVGPWLASGPAVTGANAGTAAAIADPRFAANGYEAGQYGVRAYSETVGALINIKSPGQGRFSLADPRLHGKPRFNDTYRIVPYSGVSPAIKGPGGPAGGHVLADPRPPERANYKATKYRVTARTEAAGTIIGASSTGNGGYAVADVRMTWGANAHRNKLRVTAYGGTSYTVMGAQQVGSGAQSVADPRPVCLNREDRKGYTSQGHYGVVRYTDASFAIPAFAKHDRGYWSVADERAEAVLEPPKLVLPSPEDRLVCVITAIDGTWHRPFTTMELAALQSYIEPEEAYSFCFEGKSDSVHREWIGNMVPRAAAKAMGEVAGRALLMAKAGQSFALSSEPIWVNPNRPLEIALSVDTGVAL